MTVRSFLRLLSIGFLSLVIFSSCGGSRFYQGYDYKGSVQAPDLGSQLNDPVDNQVPLAIPREQAEGTAETIAPPGMSEQSASVSELLAREETPAPVKAIAEKTLEKADVLAAEGKTITHRALVRDVTTDLVREGKIAPLSPRQEQKLARMAAKLDKKAQQQGKEIDWKHNSGLELFFMIMAIAGLVLGIVAVPIGWFVFIVFAGLWLYWKLVKD